MMCSVPHDFFPLAVVLKVDSSYPLKNGDVFDLQEVSDRPSKGAENKRSPSVLQKGDSEDNGEAGSH